MERLDETPLHVASEQPYSYPILKFLISEGANVKVVGFDTATPLLTALHYGNLPAFLLFNENANLVDPINE